MNDLICQNGNGEKFGIDWRLGDNNLVTVLSFDSVLIGPIQCMYNAVANQRCGRPTMQATF